MKILALMGLTLVIPLFAGIPIAVTLGGSGLLWLILLDPNYLRGAARAIWNSTNNQVLVSIPLFMLMGEIIQRGGFANRFYDAVAMWLRRVPGGLLHANIAACALFAAVSGSSVATAATIGKAAIPSLRRLGYAERPLLGTLAAGGTLGILIPPSIPLIIYAALCDVSLGQLFIGAMIPGILLALFMTAYTASTAMIWPETAPRAQLDKKIDFARRLESIFDMMPILVIMAVILIGLYFGWATTVEVAALGLAIALIVTFARGSLSLRDLIQSVIETVRFSAMLLLVVIGAQIFSFAVFSWGVTHEIADWVNSLPYPPLAVLLVIVGIYVLLGMFIDALSMMVLTLSVVFPIIVKLGYDPVWFGIVLVILLEVGLVTPPVGINLFTIQSLDPHNIRLSDVAIGSFPYVVIMMIFIGVLIAFPKLVLWLPSLMF